MQKLAASVYKEFLILIRDLPGLAILFIMPVLLLIVITLAQDNAIRSSRESGSDILFVDLSHSGLSSSIRKSLKESHLFILTDSVKGMPVTEEMALKWINSGKYPSAVVISPGDSMIRLILDPAIPQMYSQTLISSLSYFIRNAQSSTYLRQVISVVAGPASGLMEKRISETLQNRAPVREIYQMPEKTVIKPSIVQNNVPGFILFAMFFVVIPLSGSMVSEKNAGSYTRIRTLPVGYLSFLFSKVIIYLFVCLVQCFLMLLAGLWFLPEFFHISPLQIGNQYFPVLLVTLASALAAIGFGLIIGSLATTHIQAAMFGSVFVIALGIISGTFLPVYLFPKGLRIISSLSPIRWGIDAYLSIFIRNGNILSLLPNIFLLLLFFIIAMIFTIFIFAGKK